MSKPILLIIATNPLHNGPRMIREIEALKEHFKIYAVGSTPPHDRDIAYYNINKIYGPYRVFAKGYSILLKKYLTIRPYFAEFRLKKLIKRLNPSVIINHNPIFLPALLNDETRSFKVVFNAHEYHPLEFETDSYWMSSMGAYYSKLYKDYLLKLDLLINVSDGIAKKCFEVYAKDSLVIPNAALYNDTVSPSKTGEVVRIIHHGIPNPDRRIESMIYAVKMLGSGYQMDLMLVKSSSNYYHTLKSACEETDNVRIIPPVPFLDIVSTINHYDIGLYALPPTSFNNLFALPNKIFEFIQARLCVVVGPSPEMAKIVNDNDIGYVTNDFSAESIFKVLSQIKESDIKIKKQNAAACAHQLSAEKYYEELTSAVLGLNKSKELINQNVCVE